MSQRLTVVIPTFNEAENLSKMVSALFSLPLTDLNLLVVDDGSPDGTGQIADQLAKDNSGRMGVLHRPGKLGLGSAYLQGFDRAIREGADLIGQMDADFSHAPEKLVELVEAAKEVGLALGSRYVAGGRLDERWPLWRRALSGFGNTYARLILRLPIKDVTGGFRVWQREALLRLPRDQVRSNGYAFQVEMAYLAILTGCSVCEIPIFFADRRWGKSKMSFKIQTEAALRVWEMLFQYRHLKRKR